MRTLPKNKIIADGINKNNVVYTIYGNGEIHCHLNTFAGNYFNVFKDKTNSFINALTIKNLIPLD